MEHKVKFICCDCEATSITLVRAGLWPASPKNPQVAYTFELLNVMEALMLECQVSLKDFCEAVKLWCPFIIPDRKKIYPGIIDSFEEYRYIIHLLWRSIGLYNIYKLVLVKDSCDITFIT